MQKNRVKLLAQCILEAHAVNTHSHITKCKSRTVCQRLSVHYEYNVVSHTCGHFNTASPYSLIMHDIHYAELQAMQKWYYNTNREKSRGRSDKGLVA